MDLHNLSDEQKRQIINQYIHQKDEEHHANQIAGIGSSFIIMMLIIVGGIATLAIKGELGIGIGKFCFGAAVVIFILAQLGKALSGFSNDDILK